MVEIRDVIKDDSKDLLEIYGYYVEKTAISFEWETPSLEEFQARMAKIMESYPYLVAVNDGKICGYAYASAFVGMAAYDWSCELTIYLLPEAKKLGIGKMLYVALESSLKKMGITNLYACIGIPEVEDQYLNSNSADFHAHMGFEKVGKFHKCGYKFGNWYNMIWMEKIIGNHEKDQLTIKKYKDI